MRALPAACRELVGDYDSLPEVLYIFEHKTQLILIHDKYTRLVFDNQ